MSEKKATINGGSDGDDDGTWDVVGLRTNLGEYVIGKMKSNVLKNAAQLSIEPEGPGSNKMAVKLYPLCPFAYNDEILISDSSIGFVFTPTQQLLESYLAMQRQAETGLIIPEKQSILLG